MTKDILQHFGFSDNDFKNRIATILLKAIQTTGEIIIVTDAPEVIGEEKILFVNDAFEEVTQYSREEAYNRTPSFLQGPKTDRKVIDRLVQNLSDGNRFKGETFNYKKDGSTYRVKWEIDPIFDDEGEITHFVSVQRDVTEEWEQQQKLQEIIEDRETLIKETHHRIKNNLATITGLLELQIMKSDREEVREVLSESMNRVQSIASIHEKLYQTDGLASLTLDTYIKDLVSQVSGSLENFDGSTNISFDLQLKPVSLPMRQAVPLGLILNELITNAHKHAFDEDGGTITIACKEEGDNIHLLVKDDGRGLPEDLEIETTNSLGLKLIDTLSQQLGGEYNLTSENGTKFEMSFLRKEDHHPS